MSEREELKTRYDDLIWKQQQLQKALAETENKFTYWKEVYAIVENDLKIFKNLLQDF